MMRPSACGLSFPGVTGRKALIDGAWSHVVAPRLPHMWSFLIIRSHSCPRSLGINYSSPPPRAARVSVNLRFRLPLSLMLSFWLMVITRVVRILLKLLTQAPHIFHHVSLISTARLADLGNASYILFWALFLASDTDTPRAPLFRA
jgi:hypothetical protein